MSSKILKDTLNELGRYYGLRSADSFLNQVLGGNSGLVPGLDAWDSAGAAANLKGNRGSVVLDVSGQSDYAKTVLTMMTEISTNFTDKADQKLLNEDICITPATAPALPKPALPLNRPSVDLKGGKDEEQGIFKPEKDTDIYTTSDYIVTKEFKEEKNKVSVIQVFPAVGNLANSDTDVVSLFLNSIPTLELSRAMPMMDISILTNEENTPGKTRTLSIGRHLMGGTVDGALYPFLGSEDTESVAAAKKDGNASFSTAGSMELFTNPQTMLPVYGFESSGIRKTGPDSDGPIDPFQPMLSLTSLKINSVGTQGMHSYKSADMSLTLHDRSQLSNVLPFVSPGDLNRAMLEITYGWTHPDSALAYAAGQAMASRQSDASSANRYADLINAMRSKEVMMIVNSDFSFEESGSVTINLKLASKGEVSIITKDITLSKIVNAYVEMSKTTSEIKSVLQNFKNRKGKFGKISPPMTLMRSTNANSAAFLKTEQIDELRAFVASAKNKDMKKIGRFITTLYGGQKGKKGGKIKSFTTSKAAAIKEILDHLRTTPDPYLVAVGDLKGAVMSSSKRNPKRSKQKFAAAHKLDNKKKKNQQMYVSLGKLLSYFVGTTLADEQFDEIQMVFYPYNESAGFLFDSNISQFPIKIDELQTILSERFSNTGKMELAAFLQILNSYFLKDQGQPGYGFGNVYGKRDPDNSRKRKFDAKLYGSGKDKEKPKYQAINDKKKKRVAAAYGVGPDEPGVIFKVPAVNMRMEALKIKPPTTDKAEGGGKTQSLLRIHVYDKQCNTNTTLRNVLEGFAGDGGTFNESQRKSRQKRGAKHDVVMKHHLEVLSNSPYSIIKPSSALPDLKGIADKLGIEKASEATPEARLKKLLEGMYYLEETAANKLKGIYSGLFPTLIYGSLNSGILDAKISSMNNPALSTIAMVGAAKQKNTQSPGFDEGLPMTIQPTEVNLTVIGCPYISIGQQYFLDMGTNTSADNFYGVFEVTHNFESGKFTTDIRMGVLDTFGKWRSNTDSVKSLTALAATLVTGKTPGKK